jgi:hypothetical protein
MKNAPHLRQCVQPGLACAAFSCGWVAQRIGVSEQAERAVGGRPPTDCANAPCLARARALRRLHRLGSADGRKESEGLAMVLCGIVWYGVVWYGMVWYGMVWYGMAVA